MSQKNGGPEKRKAYTLQEKMDHIKRFRDGGGKSHVPPQPRPIAVNMRSNFSRETWGKLGETRVTRVRKIGVGRRGSDWTSQRGYAERNNLSRSTFQQWIEADKKGAFQDAKKSDVKKQRASSYPDVEAA